MGNAQVFGGLEFSMLLSLDPDRMAQLGITVADVRAAVQEQNTTNPAGRLGREPAPHGHPADHSGDDARAADRPPKSSTDIIVRAEPDGSLVRVSDIGKVTLGSRRTTTWSAG